MACLTMINTVSNQIAACDTQPVNDVIRQAEHLLLQLHDAQKRAEQRLSETGTTDPMKTITGQSSIETAIARTESFLVVMHELADDRNHTNELPFIHTNGSACDQLFRASWTGVNQYINGRQKAVSANLAVAP